MSDRAMDRIGCACAVMVAVLSACESAPEESVPPPATTTAAVIAEPPPPIPPPEPKQPWTSVHPTNLPALPPPEWVKNEAEREGSRGVLLASGRGDNAGNQPTKALRAAKKQAVAKLASWLDEHDMAAPREGAIRIAQTHMGPDGRAYVQLELELPAQR